MSQFCAVKVSRESPYTIRLSNASPDQTQSIQVPVIQLSENQKPMIVIGTIVVLGDWPNVGEREVLWETEEDLFNLLISNPAAFPWPMSTTCYDRAEPALADLRTEVWQRLYAAVDLLKDEPNSILELFTYLMSNHYDDFGMMNRMLPLLPRCRPEHKVSKMCVDAWGKLL